MNGVDQQKNKVRTNITNNFNRCKKIAFTKGSFVIAINRTIRFTEYQLFTLLAGIYY